MSGYNEELQSLLFFNRCCTGHLSVELQNIWRFFVFADLHIVLLNFDKIIF